jgi:hypothetical protein
MRQAARDLPVYLICVAAACLALGYVEITAPEAGRRFFGAWPPWAVLLGMAPLGAAALVILNRRGAQADQVREPVPYFRLLLMGSGFALLPIGLDLVADPFPLDLHVPWPAAPFYYAGMAVLAETALHLLPLALLALIWPLGPGAWRMLCCLAVATLEAALQVGISQAGPIITLFIATYIALFNLLQLRIFLLFGFLAMLSMRLGFYAIWHLAWGGLVQLGWLS